MSSLLKTWERLSVHGESSAGFVRLRLPEIRACAVYAARWVADELEAVLIEVSTESIPPKAEYAEARGLTARAEMVSPGRSGVTRLTLALSDGRYRDIFHTLADDIVVKLEEATDEPEAVRLFITRLARWQAFLRRHGHRGMSLEHRRGLFGELVLMQQHLLARTDPDTTIASWKGCRGANHDFQFSSGSIEVKTTSSNTPHAFHVANIRQLDSPGEGQLFVYFVLIEETEAGDISLPELVELLRDELDGTARDSFEDCLIEAGYLESQRELYASPRYSLRRERFYKVDESFPRLREAQLPTGVEEVRYQVALAACQPCVAFESDVWDTIFGRMEGEE